MPEAENGKAEGFASPEAGKETFSFSYLLSCKTANLFPSAKTNKLEGDTVDPTTNGGGLSEADKRLLHGPRFCLSNTPVKL